MKSKLILKINWIVLFCMISTPDTKQILLQRNVKRPSTAIWTKGAFRNPSGMNTSHLSLAKLHRGVSRAGKIILSEAAVNPGRRHMFIPQNFITGPDISPVCSIKHVPVSVKDCLRQNFYRNFSAETLRLFCKTSSP